MIRLLTTCGVVRVRPCWLCAGLVRTEDEQQHERQHFADALRGDTLADRSEDLANRAIMLLNTLIAAHPRRPS